MVDNNYFGKLEESVRASCQIDNKLFEEFEVKHIPDTRRLKWLENNK